MEYPRVTDILKCYTKYDQVPKEILEKASARGTAVHALCAGIAKGAWIPESMIQPEHLGYVNSFKKWSEAQISQYLIVEKRYYDDNLIYSGQVDFVATGKDSKLYLIDIKTSSKPQKTYPLQMAAYEYLLRGNNLKIEAAMLVYLNKNGDFPDIHIMHDMIEEWNVFYSALTCYHYFNKGKKNATREYRGIREDQAIEPAERISA